MTEQAKISINASTGAVDIEAPVSALEQIFDRVEALLLKVPLPGNAPGNVGAAGDSAGSTTLTDGEQPENNNGARPRRKRRGRQGSAKPESYKTIDLHIDQAARSSFKAFYESKTPKTQNDQLLVVMYWLLKNTSRETLTIDEIFTGLRTVGEKVPKRISSVLTNLGLKSLITKENNEVKLLHIGEDYVDDELPKEKTGK